MGKSSLLIVGAGPTGVNIGDSMRDHYDIHTLDIDERVEPHTVGDMLDMPFKDEQFNAVLSTHCLEHVKPIQVFKALNEMYRVIKPGGEFYLTVPNLDLACEWVLNGKTCDTIYTVRHPDGTHTIPVTAMDLLYGWGMAQTNDFYVHKCGFTRETLYKWLVMKPLKWDMLVVHEYRILGDYDRAEVQAYGVKYCNGDLPVKPFGAWSKDCERDCGDPFKYLTGENTERYKKEEEKDE